MPKLLHRWLAALLVVALPMLASAGIPKNNKPGEFWKDQWIAAERYMLPPHVWSIIIASLAVVATAWFAVWSYRRPKAIAPPVARDWTPVQAKKYLLWTLFGFIALYSLGFNGAFSVYDDPQNIWLNDVVKNPGWESLREIIFENHRGVNQEWMFLSLHICFQIFGKEYAGFFLMNWLMLPLLLWLVYRLAYGLLGNYRIALLSAAFFGLSPILAELVCWMLERGHYFGLIFTLSSCVSYLAYIATPRTNMKRKVGLYLLAALFYASCQFGKPIFLFVPLWLIFFDVFKRRRDWGVAIGDKVLFFVLMAVFMRKIINAGSGRGRVNDEFIGGSLLNTIALNANHVLGYMHSSFVPMPTGLRTPWNEPASWLYVTGIPDIFVHGFSPLASFVILLCLATCGLVLALRWRWGMLLLAGCGAVVSIGPVANIPVHTVVHAYRYTLSMNVLISICLAAAVIHVVANAKSLSVRRVATVLCIGWLSLGAYHTIGNIRAWRAPVHLWTRSADRLYPHDGWSHYYAGKTLQHKRRYEEALAHEHLAIRYIPRNYMANRRIGDAYYSLEEFDSAAIYFERYFRSHKSKITESYAKKLAKVGLERLVPAKHAEAIAPVIRQRNEDLGIGTDSDTMSVLERLQNDAPRRLQRAIRRAVEGRGPVPPPRIEPAPAAPAPTP